MSELEIDEPNETVDGRRLRRERNIQAVVDVVLEMFEEEMLWPSIEKAAERSGLSLRSVYRYFPDPDALVQAAIDEIWRRARPHTHLTAVGEGPFEDRLAAFAEMRVRLYEQIGNAYRAGRHHAPKVVAVRDDLARTRETLTEQFEQQFRPEIDALPARLRVTRTASADIMSQMDAIDLLRRARRLNVPETIAVVEESIRVALSPG